MLPLGEHNRGQAYLCCDGLGTRSNMNWRKEGNNSKKVGVMGEAFSSRDNSTDKGREG